MNELDTIITRVELHDDPDAVFCDMLNTLGMIADLTWLLKVKRDEVEMIAVKVLDRIGAQDVNGIRYWAGTKRDTKPRDVRDVAEVLMQACGGDWAQFCQCLSSSAWKVGECKKVLSKEVFSRVFVTTESTELKEKTLQSVPVRMLER